MLDGKGCHESRASLETLAQNTIENKFNNVTRAAALQLMGGRGGGGHSLACGGVDPGGLPGAE